MRIIFIVTIFAFLAGTFVVGFGTSLAADQNKEAILTINKTKFSLGLFNSLYNNAIESLKQQNPNLQLSDDNLRLIRSRVLEELIQTEIFAEQAENYGIIVSDEELKTDIENTPVFLTNNVFDPVAYNNFLNSWNITAKDYETIRKKQILGGKLRLILVPSVLVSPSEFADIQRFNPRITPEEYRQVKVNRILNEWFSSILKGYMDNNKLVINEELLQQQQ
jgi:peptidyl-prolyl cis-trans isomerase D